MAWQMSCAVFDILLGICINCTIPGILFEDNLNQGRTILYSNQHQLCNASLQSSVSGGRDSIGTSQSSLRGDNTASGAGAGGGGGGGRRRSSNAASSEDVGECGRWRDFYMLHQRHLAVSVGPSVGPSVTFLNC